MASARALTNAFLKNIKVGDYHCRRAACLVSASSDVHVYRGQIRCARKCAAVSKTVLLALVISARSYHIIFNCKS